MRAEPALKKRLTEISTMPVPTQEQYIKMLDTAKAKGYAYPAINVTTIEVINGALKAFAEAKSDGIIQISLGGGQFASGTAVKDSAIGAIVLAEAVHRLAEQYNVFVALHTDHCQADKVDSFLRPLLAESRKRIAEGKGPLFNSHMLDASALPMAQNLELSKQLLAECAELGIVLEIEIGVVGGEEDGVVTSGAPAEYDAELLNRYKGTLEAFVGPTQTLASGSTLQVNNYERYNWTMFNAEEKKARRETVFPEDRKAAYQLGADMLRLMPLKSRCDCSKSSLQMNARGMSFRRREKFRTMLAKL